MTSDGAPPRTLEVRSWDPLHEQSPPDAFWTTTNVGEALPGVLTPLGASLWAGKPGRGLLDGAHAVGAFRSSEVTAAAAREMFGYFHGRAAMRVEFFGRLGERMPGTSGREVVTGLLGRVPEGMTFSPTRRRYPVVAARFPISFARAPRALRAGTRAHDRWWRDSVARAPTLTLDAAQALLHEADTRFGDAVALQARCVLSGVSPVHDALVRLLDRADLSEFSVLLSPIGGAEMAVVADLWAASRGRIPVERVVRNHGFHGPWEGEISARVWREDDSPVRALIDLYRDRPDSDGPRAREQRRQLERDRAEVALLAATPASRRAGVRAVLALARTRLPLRGLAKRSLLQGLDVARLAARSIGRHLAHDGILDDPEDVFHLTVAELLTGSRAAATELVTRRRARRELYLDLELPASWKGTPPLVETASGASVAAHHSSERVSGVGVSAGVVEGVCRVVVDPSFTDVEPDEILVAPTTDPSWSSIMYVSAGLVVDIGGALSHAAVVARELGIPCVVNTGNGSRVLRSGDRIRIDGTTGTVERLAAMQSPPRTDGADR